jgi:hypothetical protein
MTKKFSSQFQLNKWVISFNGVGEVSTTQQKETKYNNLMLKFANLKSKKLFNFKCGIGC